MTLLRTATRSSGSWLVIVRSHAEISSMRRTASTAIGALPDLA
jgi:hypothetical protein